MKRGGDTPRPPPLRSHVFSQVLLILLHMLCFHPIDSNYDAKPAARNIQRQTSKNLFIFFSNNFFFLVAFTEKCLNQKISLFF